MRIVITGANGFIGSSLAAYFAASGQHEVICLVRSKRISGRREVICDIADREYLLADVAERIGKADVLIHAAACLDNNNVAELYRTNCYGTQNVVDLGIKLGLKMIIYVSSAPITGLPKESELPITEQSGILPPSVYHLTKYLGEQIVTKNCGQLPYAILRIPSPVGYGMPSGKIFSVFVQRAQAGQLLNVYGSGERIQNYVDVRDIAYGVECAIRAGRSGIWQILGQEISDAELARLCVQQFASQSEIRIGEQGRKTPVQKWRYSGARAQADLGYSPRCSLPDMIASVARGLS